MTDSSNTNAISERLRGANLYLVGMMGSGKSSTGRPLAEKLGYGFVDTDLVIEQLRAQSIEEIFSHEGEEAFRELEIEVLSAIGQRHSLVVATGGGIVVRSENWGVLHQGIVIWLDPPREILLQRLRNDLQKRPLLNSPDQSAVLDDLINQRKLHYSEADLHLIVGDESPEKVAVRILDSLPSLLKISEDSNAPQTTQH